MFDHVNIQADKHHLLQATMKDFIKNNNRCIPHSILLNHPDIATGLQDIHVPNFRTDDKLVCGGH